MMRRRDTWWSSGRSRRILTAFGVAIVLSLAGLAVTAQEEGTGGDESSSSAAESKSSGGGNSNGESSGGETNQSSAQTSTSDGEASGDGAEGNSEEGETGPTGSGPGIPIDVKVSSKRVLIPMGVPATKEPDGDTDGLAEQVTETLRRDLKLSGYFKVVPPDSYFFDTSEEGMSALDVKFKNWFNVGARGLVKSAVRIEDGKAKLDLRLFEVDTEKRVQLDWNDKPVAKGSVDQRVHSFVNAVVEHYTGTEGVFGTKIAYVKRDGSGHKQIYISGMDGSNRTQLTSNDSINMLPAWAGGAVYYTSYLHENPDLWRYKGGENHKIASYDGQNTGAAYCGGQLAVTLSMGGENADIYLVDPSSGERKQRLTNNWAIDTSPSWSPDCSKIAFVSGRAGSPQIFVMDADGSNIKRLTFKGSYNTSPDWSPKGQKIAFTARDKYNRFDIFLVDLDSNLKRLTQDQGNNEQPSFSPDGRYIMFTSDRGGNGKQLYLMTRDGQVQHPITPDSVGYSAPAWQK